MRNECVASLLWSSSRDDDNSEGVTVEKVGFSESKKPVIVTSVGKAYIYRQVQLSHQLTQVCVIKQSRISFNEIFRRLV